MRLPRKIVHRLLGLGLVLLDGQKVVANTYGRRKSYTLIEIMIMKLEVEFTRHAVVEQKCVVILEVADAESVDKKTIELALISPTKDISSFIVREQKYFDVRDDVGKVDRMKG